jgi:hypothetical protein
VCGHTCGCKTTSACMFNTLYLPRGLFHHFGYFSCDLHVLRCNSTQIPLAFRLCTCGNWFSTTPRSCVKVCCILPPADLDLLKPRPCKTVVVCIPRVKITCIWNRVTTLALCFRKFLAPPVGHPFRFRQSLHSRPRTAQLYIGPRSPFTPQGPRL